MTIIFHFATPILPFLHYPSLITIWDTSLFGDIVDNTKGRRLIRVSHFAFDHPYNFGCFTPSLQIVSNFSPYPCILVPPIRFSPTHISSKVLSFVIGVFFYHSYLDAMFINWATYIQSFHSPLFIQIRKSLHRAKWQPPRYGSPSSSTSHPLIRKPFDGVCLKSPQLVPTRVIFFVFFIFPNTLPIFNK